MTNSLDEAFSQEIRNVVPLVYGFDESEFGKLARVAVDRIVENTFRKLVFPIELGALTNAFDRIREAGFRNTIEPFDLWSGQALWCVSFITITSTGDVSVLKSMFEAIPAEHRDDHRHFVFCKCPDQADSSFIEQLQAQTRDLPEEITVFLVTERADTIRKESTLAQGAAALTYAGWKRFCAKGDGVLRAALLLPTRDDDFSFHTLGVSTVGPDLAYHAARWSNEIRGELWNRWKQETATVVPPELEAPIRLARELLPPEAYAVTETLDNTPEAPVVQVESSRFELSCHQRKRLRAVRSRTEKGGMLNHLAILKDHFFFLRHVTVTNTQGYMRKRLGGLTSSVKRAMLRYLVLPEVPEGLIQTLERQVQHCLDFTEALKQATLDARPGVTDINSAVQKVQEKISRIPRPWSAALRLLLVALGLSWLTIGGIVWGEYEWLGWSELFSDDVGNRVAIGSAAVLLLMIAGAVYQQWASRKGASNFLENLDEDIEKSHLQEVGKLLVGAFATMGRDLSVSPQKRKNGLSDLKTELAELFDSPPPRLPENTEPRFSDAGVAALLTARTSDAVHEAHRRTMAEFKEKGSATLDAKEWFETANRHIDTIALAELSTIAFEEFIDSENVTPSDRKNLIENAIEETHNAAFPGERPANPPTVLCIVSPEWREFSKKYATEFYDFKHHDLLTVAVMHVRSAVEP